MSEHHLPKGTDSTTKFYAELKAERDRLAAENAELVGIIEEVIKTDEAGSFVKGSTINRAHAALAKVKEGK